MVWLRMTAGLVLVLACLQSPGVLLAAADDEEDEAAIGSVMSSVPDGIAEQKRASAESAGLSFLGGMTAFMGSEDNIYRSPADLEKSGTAWGNQLFLHADKRWARGDKLISSITWAQTQRPRFSNANSTYGNYNGIYVRPLLGGARVVLDVGLSHRNDDAATISGKDYLRDYSYWRYGGQASLVWRLSSRHTLTFSGEQVRKNYAETPALNSIDWTEWTLSGGYRHRFAPYHYLEFLFSTGERDYREELAGDFQGEELPENPSERHRYETSAVTYTMPISSTARIEAHYDYSLKTDLFAGYESNRTHTAGLEAGVNIGTRIEARMNLSEAWRRYDAIQGDNGARLAYSLGQIEVGSRYRIIDGAWVFGSVSLQSRDTNKGTGTSYRDYRGTYLSTGMSLFF